MAESKGSGSVAIEVVKLFENLIRRSIAPSLGFFTFLAIADLARAFIDPLMDPFVRVNDWLTWIDTKQSPALLISFLLLLVGLSYALAALHQFLYDDFLRGDFAAIFGGSENETLKALRQKVKTRLGKIDSLDVCLKGESSLLNDYLLYQVLLKLGSSLPPTTPTAKWNFRGYVDRAKALGITAISAQGVLLLFAAGLKSPEWLIPIPLLFFVGREAVKGRYRSRAIRLYIHFLATPLDVWKSGNQQASAEEKSCAATP